MTREGLDLVAECVGCISALALAWQAYRLVRHQRVVRDLRRLGESTSSTKVAELATQGAEALEKSIGRWDARDQWLVVVGLIGLALSFLLKLIAFSQAG